MKKKNKVITINGGKDTWYEKAIFVAKKECNVSSDNFVDEAERIIEQYLIRTGFQNANKKQKTIKKVSKNTSIDTFLYCSMIFCCLTIALCMLI